MHKSPGRPLSLDLALALAIAIVILLGSYLRFSDLDRKVYWIDEVHTSMRVVGFPKREFAQIVPSDRPISLPELHEFQTLSSERGWGSTWSALAQNAEHAPLFYVSARAWMEWLGNAIWVPRSLAAVFSLLMFPALGWLCWELFRDARIAGIAIALAALSPIQLVYAQEAREYSLYGALILLASAALLRALRLSPHQRARWVLSGPWWLYTTLLVLSLYAHLLASLTLLAHATYVAVRDRKSLGMLALATLTSLIALVPWIVVYFLRQNSIGSWSARDVPISNLLQRWLINASAAFFDIQGLHPGTQLIDIEARQNDIVLSWHDPAMWIALIGMSLAIAAIAFAIMQTESEARCFLLSWMGFSGLVLIAADLVGGGQRSGIARYLLPCYLCIHICVAVLLATLMRSQLAYRLRLGQLLFVAILTSSLLSDIAYLDASTWWNKYSSFYNAHVADFISRSPAPLVVSSAKRGSRSLSLSYKLDPSTKFLLVSEQGSLGVEEFVSEFSKHNTYLFRPSNELYAALTESPLYRLKPAIPHGNLWTIEVARE
ncbi:putative membrane protein [Rubidibacter lacunae KORDI 51-2]|uniref:Putative membrane protein n=1 Tax=Rubidibacter lacunae KORDI 51-2 TaxID=582515 RepID=U5DQF5_9CHRO|nr:membrane protein [Rubidibacter lacunae]ERN41920.1 putative membrane protein [Rubidibacter lacunae KORDI 51-2]